MVFSRLIFNRRYLKIRRTLNLFKPELLIIRIDLIRHNILRATKRACLITL